MTKQRKQAHLKTPTIEFDAIWKGMITTFFSDFMAFFYPKLHRDIDYDYPPEFLEQELQELIEKIGFKKRIADKLVKVRLKSGIEKWIFIHIEVQSYFDRFFGRRMYEFFSWIFNKYGQAIAAVAIYTNKKTPRIFDHFEIENYGTKMRYEFLAYKVMAQKEAALMASDNIMALFVLANQYVNQTDIKTQGQRRIKLKKQIFELAFAKKINLETIMQFLTFVNHLMLLSNDLKTEFDEYYKTKAIKVMASTATFDYAKARVDLMKVFFGELSAEDKEMLKAIAREKAAEKAEQDRAKAEQDRMKYVLKLYYLKDMTDDQIADFLELDLSWVKKVISDDLSNNKKNL